MVLVFYAQLEKHKWPWCFYSTLHNKRSTIKEYPYWPSSLYSELCTIKGIPILVSVLFTAH